MTDLPTAAQIDAMLARGIGVSIRIDAAGGSREVPAGGGAAALLAATDPEAASAAHWGISVNQLQEWRQTEHYARCGALTVEGRPCGGIIPGGALDPGPWAEQDRQGYCGTHADRGS